MEKQTANPNAKGIRVLFRNRPNMFTQRGGDTVVIEKTVAKLHELGVDAVIDEAGREDISQFDIVHLYNFTLPQMVEQQAREALAANKPFVVTTLNEDVPSFHNQSHAVSAQLVEYVGRGQDASWYEAHKVSIDKIAPCPMFDNTWTVEHASMLFTCGPAETKVLQHYYPTARIAEARVSHELPEDQPADLFINTYGIEDFILCVGRLESRKNQLQVLKALEHVDLPVVLVAGDFSYQREYAEAVRSFKRRGPTIVLDHLSDELLASAYKAAKVHVLASWFEFPGLVSLEAAYFDCNVVVSDAGTTRDYFGDNAWYCSPGDESSILQAVLAAYYSPLNEETKSVALNNHDWKRCASVYIRSYEAILNEKRMSAEPAPVTIATPIAAPQGLPQLTVAGMSQASAPQGELLEIIEKGENAA
ncbi:MAG: glycosyltransferase, partial [Bdellovibrionales bacterium]|nr:glycosyltransferase [Bdellovibrionales bacterium]